MIFLAVDLTESVVVFTLFSEFLIYIYLIEYELNIPREESKCRMAKEGRPKATPIPVIR